MIKKSLSASIFEVFGSKKWNWLSEKMISNTQTNNVEYKK